MNIQDVSIRSVLRPFKMDNILNFMVRYQAQSAVSAAGLNILRSYLLNTLLMNLTSTTSNGRLCAAVRVNKVEIYTSVIASIEWVSLYGPTSATVISATNANAAGVLVQRPPKDSLCSFWSKTGSNETEAVFALTFTVNDYIDVFFSVVLMDQESGVTVTTTAAGTATQVYRSYLDGPRAGAVLLPIYTLSLN